MDEAAKLLSLARGQSVCLWDHHRQQEKIVTLKLREKLDNQRRKHLKEAADAKRRANLVRAVLVHGGPCETETDARRLRPRLEESGQRHGAIKEAFKNEIRYQKTILNSKGTLKLSGNISDLAKALQDLPHISQQHPHHLQDFQHTSAQAASHCPSHLDQNAGVLRAVQMQVPLRCLKVELQVILMTFPLVFLVKASG